MGGILAKEYSISETVLRDGTSVIEFVTGWRWAFFIRTLAKGSSLPEVRSKARPSDEQRTRGGARASLQLEMPLHLFQSVRIRPCRGTNIQPLYVVIKELLVGRKFHREERVSGEIRRKLGIERRKEYLAVVYVRYKTQRMLNRLEFICTVFI